MTTTRFSDTYFNSLTQAANASPRRRQSRTIHITSDDPCQRLFNAIEMDSYVRPHRHRLDPKFETLFAIRGRFLLVTFSEMGEIEEVIPFHSEKYDARNDSGAGVEIQPGTWHTIIATEPHSIMLEVKVGPFNLDIAKEPAPWSPAEDTPERLAYLAQLKKRIGLYRV
jgi:cupin fold WbuC family metalloprotein